MLRAFPESPESPNRPLGLFGVLGLVPKEGSIAHASMCGFATLTLSVNGVLSANYSTPGFASITLSGMGYLNCQLHLQA